MGKIRRIVGSLFRRPIDFSDQLRTEPISRKFGFDRGCPIDRYYIDSFLKQNQNLITGSVLEIAESTYSKQFGHDIASYEVLHYDDSNKKATIVGDLTKPETLPKERIDCFICTQTLNFIFGNALAATAFLQGLAIDDLPDTSLLDKKDLDYQITIGIKATKC